ncbi:MAG: ORC1-type DNA replication protein [Candidatus Lokiarchaeota archaeon]|nr:ORC1-type DNA replication protein [Candidatus Lokiarchaeota archaeon]
MFSMTIDYFEDLLRKPTLFKCERALENSYIPNKLPHREKELSLLSRLFLELITNPNSISRKILITGKTGIGKTATIKLFGEMLMNAARKRSNVIKYIHINCRKERTSYKVLIKIIDTLNINFPKRGYSPQDLLDIIIDIVHNQNFHLLIVLDELSYLINNSEDLIYSLTRINDDSFNNQQHISIIGIVRDISCISSLDISTMSTLQRNIIHFKKYTNEQLCVILRYRVSLSLKENVMSDKLIETIADLVYQSGDIRYGLNLIWKATKIAENQNLKHITMECVRLANHDIVPFSTIDVLKYIPIQKGIFLLGIITALKKSGRIQVSVLEITNSYLIICENLAIHPRSHSQLWNYLQEFKRECLINMEIKSESIKGRKALISVQDIPISKFEEILVNILQTKGIEI